MLDIGDIEGKEKLDSPAFFFFFETEILVLFMPRNMYFRAQQTSVWIYIPGT